MSIMYCNGRKSSLYSITVKKSRIYEAYALKIVRLFVYNIQIYRPSINVSANAGKNMIITEANPILRAIAKPVTNFGSEDLKLLIARMFEIMHEKNGVGLAAPQIGVSLRIFVYGFESNKRYPDAPPVPKNIIINPAILSTSEETIALEEGCLSVPHRRGVIMRSKSIIFNTMDIEGNVHRKTVHDFEARIVQHEIDHINGILISDRASIMRDTTIT